MEYILLDDTNVATDEKPPEIYAINFPSKIANYNVLIQCSIHFFFSMSHSAHEIALHDTTQKKRTHVKCIKAKNENKETVISLPLMMLGDVNAFDTFVNIKILDLNAKAL